MKDKANDLIKIQKEREYQVVKANNLIQKSRFSLSTQQQKILLYLISKITKEDKEFKLYEFPIVDFCKVCGIDYDNGKNYISIKQQIKEIADKSMWITLENGEETLLRWIEKPYISKKSGIIKIKLDEDMKPYLLDLKNNFTKYSLIYALSFRSKYTIRLYEYLKSVHFDKTKPYIFTITKDKLKKIMDADVYNDFKDFHRKAVKVAVNEINEKTDIFIKYDLIRKNRVVQEFKFVIIPKDIEEQIKGYEAIEIVLDKGE